MWATTAANFPRLLSRVLCTTVLLTSCSTQETPPPSTVAADLYQYYEQFYVSLASRGLTPRAAVRRIEWVKSLPGDTIGVCAIWQSSAESVFTSVLGSGKPRIYTYRVIQISMQVDPANLKRLMFHELGHCILDLCHSTQVKDIMYPSVVTPYDQEAADALFQTFAEGRQYDDCEYSQ